MKIYSIYTTETFNRLYPSLDKTEQTWINKIKNKLEENITGKPLYSNWFREKKYLNKRLYFIIDERSKKILFISFASKKEQQNIINFVKSNMEELFSYLRRF